MAIGVKSGGLFSGIFLGYICACLQLPSKGLRVVVLMAYLKIIWGFGLRFCPPSARIYFELT
jgi:hypothetical protein